MSDLNQSNILAVYSQATEAELRHGMNWYKLANLEARKLSMEFGCTISTAAGVIAALSPNQSWQSNLTVARTLFRDIRDGKSPADIRIPAYPLNKLKACAIIGGRRPLSVLGGPKVLAFYQTILHPDASTAVTVDGHAYSIWEGKRHLIRNTVRTIPCLERAGRYETIVSDYREVASKLGILPWQLQAITWLAWRRVHNTHSHVRDMKSLAAAA